MSTENYYKPWCNRCNKYVHPQVVSSTHVYGGGGGVGSSVTHEKMCPECGDEVFSQSDVEAYKRKQEAAKQNAKVVLIVTLILVAVPIAIVILFVVVFFYFLWPSR